MRREGPIPALPGDGLVKPKALLGVNGRVEQGAPFTLAETRMPALPENAGSFADTDRLLTLHSGR